MRAAQYSATAGGIEKNLKLEEDVPDLVLPTNEPAALVEVLHASLNPQDYKIAELPVVGALNVRRPASPGTDFVGRISDASLPGFEKGDLVFGSLHLPTQHGTLGQFIIVKAADGVVKVPQAYIDRGLDLRLLACLGTAGLTALQTFRNVEPGAHVFINGGSGGTGTFCIQIARNVCQAERIVVTTSTPNTELVRRMGADEAINYRDQDVIMRLEQAVGETGRKFDLVVDNVGNSEDLYWKSHRFLKTDGRFICIGAPNVNMSYALKLARMHIGARMPWSKSPQLITLFVETKNEDLEKMAQWILEDNVTPVVHAKFRLEDAAQAFADLKTGRTPAKLVIDVAAD